jgi:hypothetical protein
MTVRAVSTQYCGNVSVILVQYSSPAEVLDAIAIGKLQSVLSGKIIVCSADGVPSSCLAAFSASGAVAVISSSQEDTTLANIGDSRSLSAFWARFYSELQSCTDVAMALRKAEESEPVLDGAYRIYP